MLKSFKNRNFKTQFCDTRISLTEKIFVKRSVQNFSTCTRVFIELGMAWLTNLIILKRQKFKFKCNVTANLQNGNL